MSGQSTEEGIRGVKGTIWIDMDNTPHVPFFRPIARELEKLGFDVLITARDAFQVCDLARSMRVPFVQIGRHYGKNKIIKVAGIIARASQLLPFVLRNRPTLGVSHGSRAQILLCNLLRIPTVLMADYEHVRPFPFTHPTYLLLPEALRSFKPRSHQTLVLTYIGIKEDVYVPEFNPDESLLQQLGLDRNRITLSVRPPATEAHYYCRNSEALFLAFMEWIITRPIAQVVMLPRNKKQEDKMRRERPHWFADCGVIVPGQVIDGLNLLWHSDFVVSGGGTMNREAAALGVPVYSIFRGQLGAVDRQLVTEGRLVLLENPDDFDTKIAVAKRQFLAESPQRSRRALRDIVGALAGFVEGL